MITASMIVSAATIVALLILSLSFLFTVYRVIKGPTLPDRIIALDMLVGIVIGFIAVIAIKTGFTLYIDIAIALGLVGFLATVAFARFVLSRAPEKSSAVANVSKPKEKTAPIKASKRKR